MNEPNVIVVPGLGGSSPGHWQALWQSEHPTWTRFQPSSWNQPELADWASSLDHAVDQSESGAILLAHSLDCLRDSEP
jgi:predicted alpha/beta hydrolase family esterase